MVNTETGGRERPRILIVEDDAEIVDFMQLMLAQANCDVRVAYSGEEALTALRRARGEGEEVDLVLLDIMMPGMDGYEVMARTKGDPDLRNTSFIVTTALDSVSDKTLGLGMGADDYLTKPFDPRELLARIDAVMRIRRSEQALTRRNQELAALVEINRVVSSSLELEEVLAATMEGIGEIIRVEAGALALLDEESGTFTYRKWLASDEEGFTGQALQPGVGIVGHVIASGEPKLVNDVEREPCFSGEGSEGLMGVVPEAILCVPLTIRDRTIGAIELVNKSDGPFDEQDLELVSAMAASVAVAVDNANLYAELADFADELERSQAKLVQAEKMAAIGRLAASLAHEINNPLQAIHNSLHLSMHEGLGEERREEYLDMARSEVERLIEIVQRMLEFYRPPRGGGESADLNQVVKRVVALAEKRIEHGDVEVETELGDGLPAVPIAGDEISQVVLNLLINAVEAMPTGGRLRLKTEVVGESDQVSLSVRDSGPGMSAEQVERLFEPFYTTKPEGTGLGLAISYGIVERHGGAIDVVSEADRGTTFVVTLPLEPVGRRGSREGR